MIGRPKWFQRRKYGGWGITPKTWQGYVYLAAILIPFIIFQALPFWTNSTRLWVTIGWMTFLLIDVVDIMIRLKKDEREYKIEAIAERNAAWFMSIIAAIAIAYEAIISGLTQTFQVDIFLIILLFGGMLVKTISNVILERKSL